MNIALISKSSSYDHLASKFQKQGHSVEVFYDQALKLTTIPKFVMASGIPVCRDSYVHTLLTNNKIPYFFVNNKCTEYENDKFVTKKMLRSLNIPTPNGELVNGAELKTNFRNYKTPFVVKVNYAYFYGRQTVIVTEENREDVYNSLFGKSLYHIKDNASVVVEEFVELEREYSYHALFNYNSWRFFGAARDYKKIDDGDVGYNSVSCGAYSTQDVDKIVHEYADKIYKHFKKLNLMYRGFIFLGIGVRKDGTPMILEINTRSGDPELQVMVECIENDLARLFLDASCDYRLPEIKFNGKQAVTISLINKHYDWTIPAYDLPDLKDIPSNITYSKDHFADGLKHGVLTAVSETKEKASKIIYDYLDNQYLGQYRYRKDIGLLK